MVLNEYHKRQANKSENSTAVVSMSGRLLQEAIGEVNAGNTAWMIVASALVLLMNLPGLALFYGGMLRQKNILASLMQKM